MHNFDVTIIGAGAAGLMAAIETGKRGKKVLIIDQANKPGKKILMSGGGRCNFTNLNITPNAFISHNPHFCKSAIKRYTQWDFISLVKQYGIAYHEKTLGQLFCDNKASDILNMLLAECQRYNVEFRFKTNIAEISRQLSQGFKIRCNDFTVSTTSLIIATGGLSIPSMGSSPFGYHVAQQFGLAVWPTRAGLVPLTWNAEEKIKFSELSGISVAVEVHYQKQIFVEDLLFTHRGLSGPAILQISSYWQLGQAIVINFLPNMNLLAYLQQTKRKSPQKLLKNLLSELLPKRMLEVFFSAATLNAQLANISNATLSQVANELQAWHWIPNGSEGYRTAEVTLGGVDCNALSSQTMQTSTVPGLYFIGEVVDVTGWLGGYNFQWAWSSGWAAGQVA